MREMAGETCVKCGYELTGLGAQGRCPECGTYYDVWSGEGIGGGPRMQKYRRGDWVARLLQTLGLLFLALLFFGGGAAWSWHVKKVSPIVVTGVMAVLCLVSAVVTGMSLRKH